MDSKNLFFTSDTHFGHKRIPEFCPYTRPQGVSPEEMDEIMIKRWNEVVPKNGTVFNLGDVTFWRDYDKLANIYRRLNGQHHIILGNHDELVIENRRRLIDDGFVQSIRDYHEIRVEGHKVNLFHFPMAVWNKNHHGAFHLYGHCHGSFKAVGKQMDVGWDTLDLGKPFVDHIPGPISWQQVYDCLSKREKVVQDHHGD